MLRVKHIRLIAVVLLLPLSLVAQNFGGGPGAVTWRQVNTPKARVIFPFGLDSQANRISNIVALLDSTTAYSIGGNVRKWNIVLRTYTTTSNAYVRLAPLLSELYMMPPQNGFDEGSIRWDDNLIVHENRHMQQLSNFNSGLTKVFSFFLGQEGQLLANGLVIPNHFFEGDAVWQETLVTTQGRGRFPNFFNGFKSLWLEHKNYSWMKLRSGSYKDYTPDHYRLGYMMVAYANEKYGDEFWRNVTRDAVHFKGVFYPFNKAIKTYSGKSYRRFRSDALEFFKSQSFPPGTTGNDSGSYITDIEKNNVVDYQFPSFISDDSILVAKTSYRSLNSLYLLIKGKEVKIRVLNTVLDNDFAYSKGKVVYASYQSDPRWLNRDYSVLQLVDLKSHRQKQLTFRTKYFSPVLNKDATEIIAVHVSPGGGSNLVRLNANTGALLIELPNPHNYFFTQTNYLNAYEAVSVVRDPGGKNALVKINLATGITDSLTPFTFNVLGYPFVKGDTIFFDAMNGYSDKILAVNVSTGKISQVTNNSNGIYTPAINAKGEMLVSAFTAEGSRLLKINIHGQEWKEIAETDFEQVTQIYTAGALKSRGAGALYTLKDERQPVSKYRKSFQLFNFHSWRPVISDADYGYSLYGDNVLGSFSNNLTYTYNRNERSHTLGFNAVYAGWYPVLSLGVQGSFNRNISILQPVSDTTDILQDVDFNSAKLNAVISLPLSYVGGRTNKFFNLGAGYNAEQLYYSGIGKNIFTNKPLHYLNSFLSFSNVNKQAKQHVNPRWAQVLSAGYRRAFSYRESRKFVGSTAFYFPGFFANHSFVLQAAFQKRDTLPDLFSNTFSYSRGYQALSTRRMYKLGVNYQLPVAYPDLGFGNIIFFQRIRVNGFYDYTDAYARLNGKLTDIVNRSAGAEIYFDTEIWNALPISFIVRFSHLFDTNLRNPALKNRWEFILPLGIIPH